jgi:DNA repair exonuclease SbcCD nuclease subunit
MLCFIHAADLHLDSPLRGLQQYEGAPSERIRTAARSALVRLVDLAIERRVHFVVLAGDIYDGDWPDYSTGQFFGKQMGRLNHAGIPVFMISGNHDAQSKITRTLVLPNNVTRFDPHQAHSVRLDSLGVAIHGQSFATPAVTQNLSLNYPAAVPGYFNLGILHTCATGRDGHLNYAPCTVEDLCRHDYDYWALGHIHQREILRERPFIAFSGNIQGRHIGETGPKGCLLVTVDEQRRCEAQFEALDVMRWEHIEIDTPCHDSLEQLLEEIDARLHQALQAADDRWIACRISIRGSTELHELLNTDRTAFVEHVRSLANQLGNDACWIEKVRIETAPLDTSETHHEVSEDALSEVQGVLNDLQRGGLTLSDDEWDLASIATRFHHDLRPDAPWLNQAWTPDLLEEARTRLLRHLQSQRGAP